MSDFKGKMHQILCQLGLRPRPRWGSLQRSPRPSGCILGGLILREGREGEGRGGTKGEGREEREGDPLLSRYTPQPLHSR